MQCIGDECATLTPRSTTGSHAPLMRSVAIGAVCAGLGYFAAAQVPREEKLSLASVAPPLVLVSELTDE